MERMNANSSEQDLALLRDWLEYRNRNGSMTVEVEEAKRRLVVDALSRLVISANGGVDCV